MNIHSSHSSRILYSTGCGYWPTFRYGTRSSHCRRSSTMYVGKYELTENILHFELIFEKRVSKENLSKHHH